MNNRYFYYIFALFFPFCAIFSCKKVPSASEEAETAVAAFSKSYYSWQLAEAMPLADEALQQKLRFLASNVNQSDLNVLHQATEEPEVEIVDLALTDDATAKASLHLRNIYVMDTIGRPVHLCEEAKAELTLTLSGGKWIVKEIR